VFIPVALALGRSCRRAHSGKKSFHRWLVLGACRPHQLCGAARRPSAPSALDIFDVDEPVPNGRTDHHRHDESIALATTDRRAGDGPTLAELGAGDEGCGYVIVFHELS
jgi:hypothetical protein